MNLRNRIAKLENRDGFNSETERQEYIGYARKIDPDISADQIKNPRDYVALLESVLPPLPESE